MRLLDCPNCGVGGAIPIIEETKPDDFVQCNTCEAEYTLKYLKARIKKSEENKELQE